MSSRILKPIGLHLLKSGVVASGLFLFLVMQGCSDAHTLVWNKADAVIDGHRVVISPCRSSYTKTVSDTPTNRDHTFGCGSGITVQIKNEELTINAKSYGTLKRGDSVLVRNGSVFINEKEAGTIAMR
jgi:hypothetical protein